MVSQSSTLTGWAGCVHRSMSTSRTYNVWNGSRPCHWKSQTWKFTHCSITQWINLVSFKPLMLAGLKYGTCQQRHGAADQQLSASVGKIVKTSSLSGEKGVIELSTYHRFYSLNPLKLRRNQLKFSWTQSDSEILNVALPSTVNFELKQMAFKKKVIFMVPATVISVLSLLLHIY